MADRGPEPAPTLPASWYVDPAVYERERTAIFAREWQVVGAASRVAEPGTYIAAEMAGWPVVVVRDATGSIRGFHNVCRHRAAPLVEAGAGSCSGGFVCPYHGWSYATDGTLRRARDFGCNPGEQSLLPVRAEAWRGLLFVNLDMGAAPLLASLGAFAAEAAGFDMEAFELTDESSHVVACNWKTYADNYGEGYHVPFVHPELNRQIDARAYQVDVFDRWCRHSAPARDGSLTTGSWLWRFPNLGLNLYPDGMNVERFTPLGPDRTRIDYSFFFRDGSHDPETIALSTEILAEDAAICEAVQRNLAAGAYAAGVLSPRHETGLAMLQRLVRESLER
jgi:choline monooxygenase